MKKKKLPIQAGWFVKMGSPGWMSLDATMYLPTYSDFLIVYKASFEWSDEVGSYEPITIGLGSWSIFIFGDQFLRSKECTYDDDHQI